MLISYNKYDFLQFRSNLGTVYRGFMFLRQETDIDRNTYIVASCKFATEYKKDFKKNNDFEAHFYLDQIAPDFKFKPSPSIDDYNSFEQKLRDINLHVWLYNNALCSRPPKDLVKPVQQRIINKSINMIFIPRQENGKIACAGAFIREEPNFESTGIVHTFEYPSVEFKCLAKLTQLPDLQAPDGAPAWKRFYKAGEEYTWYQMSIILPGSIHDGKIGWIHDSRVQVKE